MDETKDANEDESVMLGETAATAAATTVDTADADNTSQHPASRDQVSPTVTHASNGHEEQQHNSPSTFPSDTTQIGRDATSNSNSTSTSASNLQHGTEVAVHADAEVATVGRSTLLSVEHDHLDKFIPAGSSTVDLSGSIYDLEQQVQSKVRAISAVSGTPGANAINVAASAASRENGGLSIPGSVPARGKLETLERDILQKFPASGSRIPDSPAARPGAVAVPGTLDNLEQAIQQKSDFLTSRGSSGRDKVPGAVTVQGTLGNLEQAKSASTSFEVCDGTDKTTDNHETVPAQGSLDALEQDIIRKFTSSESRASAGRATFPGAVAVRGMPDSPEQAKSRSPDSGSGDRVTAPEAQAALGILERDILQKFAAPESNPPSGRATVPGAIAVQGIPDTSSLEQDIIRKFPTSEGIPPHHRATVPGAVAVPGTLDNLEQSIQAKSGSAPSVGGDRSTVPGAGVVQGTLDTLEQDIIRKFPTPESRLPDGQATYPGAVAVPGTLDNLEQAIQAKSSPTAPRPDKNHNTTAPGAVAVRGTLDGLERNILEKSSGAPAKLSIASAGLSRLEQEIVAKTPSRPIAPSIVRPGAVAVVGDRGNLTNSNATLSQLEQDVVVKMQSTGGGGSDRRNIGGAQGASLNQLENDIMAKYQSRQSHHQQSGSLPIRPGAVSVPGPGAASSLYELEDDITAKSRAAGFHDTAGYASKDSPNYAAPAPNKHTQEDRLTQLESDILAKYESQPPQHQAARNPGAMTVPGNGDYSFQLGEDGDGTEQAMITGQGAQPGVQAANRLDQLEQDILAKFRAGGNVVSSSQPRPDIPGALSSPPVNGSGESMLLQMEQQIAAKLSGNMAFIPPQDDVSRSQPPSFGDTGAGRNPIDLARLEHTTVSQQSTPNPLYAFGQRNYSSPLETPPFQTLQNMEEEIVGNVPLHMRGHGSAVEMTMLTRRDDDEEGSLEEGNADPLRASRQRNDSDLIEDDYHDSFASRSESPTNLHTEENDDAHAPTSSPPPESAQGGRNTVDAFVADTVVAATSAFVVNEDGEQARKWRKSRKMLGYSAIIMAVIVVVIVVVLRVTGNNDVTQSSTATTDNISSASPTSAPINLPSNAPTTARFSEFINLMSSLYDDTALFDKAFESGTGTPQYRAIRWLYEDGNVDVGANQQQFLQRFALATFYFTIDGDSWQQCSRTNPICTGGTSEEAWLVAGTDECAWEGVRCDDNKQVVSIVMNDRDRMMLQGSLPFELAFLSGLVRLSAADHKITGQIPDEWERMSSLVTLSLENNQITGSFPSMLLINNRQLHTIDLFGNNLKGEIPPELGLLNLRNLRLSDNSFSGVIPTSIGQIQTLVALELSGNNLESTLPPGLFEESDLKSVDVSFNKDMTGTFPDNVGLVATQLTNLRFGGTQMTGEIPDSLFNLVQLQFLDLSDAGFRGTVSESFAQLSDLRILSLEGNSFSGSIPSALGGLSRLKVLELAENDLFGSIPMSLCDRRGIKESDVQRITADWTGNSPPVYCPTFDDRFIQFCCSNCRDATAENCGS